LSATKIKKRILCVDDHKDTCVFISNILEDYEVVGAAGKGEALTLATDANFDLYLLDYLLPDGNGIELCLLIKNFDKETPILFITGTSTMNEAQAFKVGAQGLLIKGYVTFAEKLKSIVSELLKD
jgi:CheY-like chemotaxis protein